MVKKGYTLYATRVYAARFRKQAKSPSHFVRLCVEEEKRNGYAVPRKFFYMYEPDFTWSEKLGVWLKKDGSVYGKTLPPGF